VSRLARKVQCQAVRKPQRRPRSEEVQRSLHDIRILNRHVFMIEQHFDRRRKAGGIQRVDGSKDPGCLGQR